MKTFLFRYQYEGEQWAFSLQARDPEDAQARLNRLVYASLDGEHIMTVPAALGPLAGISIAVRNAVKRLLNSPH